MFEDAKRVLIEGAQFPGRDLARVGLDLALMFGRQARNSVVQHKAILEKPFEGDRELAGVVKKAVELFGIKQLIETGTNVGSTALALSELGLPLTTIERIKRLYERALVQLGHIDLVSVIHGKSQEVLPRVLCSTPTPVLLYLDAHWGISWPLRDELIAIGQTGRHSDSVIVVHDVYLPGTRRGFESYWGTTLRLENFLHEITAINKDYWVSAPSDSNADLPGWIMLHPRHEDMPDSVRLGDWLR